MTTTLNDSLDNVKDIMSSAKQGTEHAVSSTRSLVFDGIRAAAGIAAMVRGFGVDDALGWIGLARRRPASSFAMFGAGIAVGAGLGMLFAPMKGTDARRAILGRLTGMAREASRTVDKAEAGAREVEQKVEKKVGDLAGKVEHKAEDLTSKARDAAARAHHEISDAVTERAEAAKAAVKSAVVAAEAGNHRPSQPGR